MGDVSRDFSRWEFACGCGCGFDAVDVDVLEMVQSVRSYFKKPVNINSGCRCKKHNRNIGGSKKSQHMLGKAVDIWIDGTAPEAIAFFVNGEYPEMYGIIIHDDFVHLDIRGKEYREDKRN